MTKTNFPNLLSPIKVGRLTYRNRIIMGPYQPNAVDYGYANAMGIAYYETRARGGAAQLTVGETPVDFDFASRRPADTHFNILRENPLTFQMFNTASLVTAVQRHGAYMSIELSHIGLFNNPDMIKDGKDPIGPCDFIRYDGVHVHGMTACDIDDVCESYANAAEKALEHGFDSVLIHGGHGWLLSQFLSPLYNHRTDEYGGSLENRARFPIAVLDRIRSRVGDRLNIEYRISGEENVQGGMEIDEVVEFLKLIEDRIDMAHISAGVYCDLSGDPGIGPGSRMFPSIYEKQGCNTHLSEKVKKALKIPVAVVGAISFPEVAESIIAEGKADLVVMVKQLFADPDYAYKLATKRRGEIRPCLRCYRCMSHEKRLTDCSVNPSFQFEYCIPYSPPRSGACQRVMVIGGGPAGMQAAITAAENGHSVVLIEREAELGGIIRFAEHDMHKRELLAFLEYLRRRVAALPIELRLGVEATPESVEAENPDVLITAVGSSPTVPAIPGLKENAVHALEVYGASERLGENIAMIGGGLVGCETAVYLASLGKRVTVLEMLDGLARDAMIFVQAALLKKMDELGVKKRPGTSCLEVTRDGVRVRASDSREEFISADSVVFAVGMRANSADALNAAVVRAIPVGDCTGPKKVGDAIGAGYLAALDI